MIADRLATVVNLIYSEPTRHEGAPLLLATYFFAVQIYCDFSGYSDIAIGAAEVMGFRLMKNFERPYASRSIGEFWRRWHISLSTWFRDYLYTPLRQRAARRAGHDPSTDHRTVPLEGVSDRLLRYRDLSIVFLVSGLWHGASWTYVVWGALHAFYLVAGLVTRSARGAVVEALRLHRWPRLLGAWRCLVVFHLAALAWIFFRARTIADAMHVVRAATRGLTAQALFGPELASKLATSRSALLVSLALVGLLFVIESFQGEGRLRSWVDRQHVAVRWTLYYGVVTAIVFFGEFKAQEFIYFQF